jgi:hypothetical protein
MIPRKRKRKKDYERKFCYVNFSLCLERAESPQEGRKRNFTEGKELKNS